MKCKCIWVGSAAVVILLYIYLVVMKFHGESATKISFSRASPSIRVSSDETAEAYTLKRKDRYTWGKLITIGDKSSFISRNNIPEALVESVDVEIAMRNASTLMTFNRDLKGVWVQNDFMAREAFEYRDITYLFGTLGKDSQRHVLYMFAANQPLASE
jgi:hypothetical protein